MSDEATVYRREDNCRFLLNGIKWQIAKIDCRKTSKTHARISSTVDVLIARSNRYYINVQLRQVNAFSGASSKRSDSFREITRQFRWQLLWRGAARVRAALLQR